MGSANADQVRMRTIGITSHAIAKVNSCRSAWTSRADAQSPYDIAAFLDVKNLPITGDLTGTLHLEGPKSSLEGSGRVTVKNGSIYGEPVDVATADIAFTQGTMRATKLNVTSPAGQITGEAELNMNTNKFSYIINSSSVDISKLKIASTLAASEVSEMRTFLRRARHREDGAAAVEFAW